MAAAVGVVAVTPDPGHPANEIGAGVFGEVGSYIFPSGSKVGIGIVPSVYFHVLGKNAGWGLDAIPTAVIQGGKGGDYNETPGSYGGDGSSIQFIGGTGGDAWHGGDGGDIILTPGAGGLGMTSAKNGAQGMISLMEL